MFYHWGPREAESLTVRKLLWWGAQARRILATREDR